MAKTFSRDTVYAWETVTSDIQLFKFNFLHPDFLSKCFIRMAEGIGQGASPWVSSSPIYLGPVNK